MGNMKVKHNGMEIVFDDVDDLCAYSEQRSLRQKKKNVATDDSRELAEAIRTQALPAMDDLAVTNERSSTIRFVQRALQLHGPLPAKRLVREMVALGWRTAAKGFKARSKTVSSCVYKYGSAAGVAQDGRGRPYYLTPSHSAKAAHVVPQEDESRGDGGAGEG